MADTMVYWMIGDGSYLGVGGIYNNTDISSDCGFDEIKLYIAGKQGSTGSKCIWLVVTLLSLSLECSHNNIFSVIQPRRIQVKNAEKKTVKSQTYS